MPACMRCGKETGTKFNTCEDCFRRIDEHTKKQAGTKWYSPILDIINEIFGARWN
jgi:predicted amidophosphoribosyltransferase